jgi:hypothetical protein
MLNLKTGPSRASGGEQIFIRLARAKTISEIKLTGYSASKQGKTLIHAAVASNGATKTMLEGLTKFSKMTNGTVAKYKETDQVMVTDTTFIAVAPGAAFTQLELKVEGYTNNDNSLLLQITSNDGLGAEDFIITRTANGETLGGLIDESKYAKFGLNELQALMGRAVSPALDDVVGKTFVCSNYTRLDGTKLNFKSRRYMSPSAGVLQSFSDLQGPVQTWSQSPHGVQLPIENNGGCGKYITKNTMRVTAAGNLIAEVILELEPFLTLCERAGFDREGARAVEINSTFPSVIDAKYVVDSYEFCRPQ